MNERLKDKTGITLVSLVVTIIILIILAGISINMTIGNNGILTIAKQARENMELDRIEEERKMNELYSQIEAEEGETGRLDYDAIAKLNHFKKEIADYIEEAGGIKPDYTAESSVFGESIKGIVKEVTKEATATEEDIEEGKTAWVNGEMITGTKKTKKGVYINNESFLVTSGSCSFSLDLDSGGTVCTFSDTSSSNNQSGTIRNFAAINVTNLKKITINTDYYKTGTGWMYVYIGNSSNMKGWTNTNGTIKDCKWEINVENLTGEQYIYFAFSSLKSGPGDTTNHNEYTCSFRVVFKDIILE